MVRSARMLKPEEQEEEVAEEEVDIVDVTPAWLGYLPTQQLYASFGNKSKQNKGNRVVERRKRKKPRFQKALGPFCSCTSKKKQKDLPLCLTEVFLVLFISLLLLLELWITAVLGRRYFFELETWFKFIIFILALLSVFLKEDFDILNVLASIGICLAWIEVIFLIGRLDSSRVCQPMSRFPLLGGKFGIMFYTITKTIIQVARFQNKIIGSFFRELHLFSLLLSVSLLPSLSSVLGTTVNTSITLLKPFSKSLSWFWVSLSLMTFMTTPTTRVASPSPSL